MNYSIFGVLLLILALMPWSCGNNYAKAFSSDENVCLEISKTLYTNVGTPIFGQDGKPVACTPVKAIKKN